MRVLVIFCVVSVVYVGLVFGQSLNQKADSATQSTLLNFWNGDANYLSDFYGNNKTETGYWIYAQALDAVLDAVERTNGEQYYGMIATLIEHQEAIGFSRPYYDDENWMCLALIRAAAITKNQTHLEQAVTLFKDVMAQWDATCCGATLGGVWWDAKHTQKATASNAGASLTAARLYRLTGDRSYLEFAEKVFTFWFDNFVNASTGQVADHMNAPTGDKVWWKFTYNEGLMIGAAQELFEATKTVFYMDARDIIRNFMLKAEIVDDYVLFDGSNADCTGDCAQFKGIGYRYLLSSDPDAASQSVLNKSADAIWTLARDPARELFSVNWVGPAPALGDDVTLAQMNCAASSLNLLAREYESYSGGGIPQGQYEAENAYLDGVWLHNDFPGFTNWGFVRACDSFTLRFDRVNVTQSTATVSIRYRNGGGDMYRLIVNGKGFTFVNLALNDNWTTVATSVDGFIPNENNYVLLMGYWRPFTYRCLDVDNITVG